LSHFISELKNSACIKDNAQKSKKLWKNFLLKLI